MQRNATQCKEVTLPLRTTHYYHVHVI